MSGRPSHRTAVVILPPPERQSPIQTLRRRHDRQIGRWPPHVNLLYPFVAPETVPVATPALRQAVAGVAPFRLTLGEPRWFVHRGERFTIWLAPGPVDALAALQEAVERPFPGFDHLRRFPGGFTPHLSVGQARGARALERVIADCRRTWRPLTWEVREIALLCRGAATPFAVVERFPLGVERG